MYGRGIVGESRDGNLRYNFGEDRISWLRTKFCTDLRPWGDAGQHNRTLDANNNNKLGLFICLKWYRDNCMLDLCNWVFKLEHLRVGMKRREN